MDYFCHITAEKTGTQGYLEAHLGTSLVVPWLRPHPMFLLLGAQVQFLVHLLASRMARPKKKELA